MDLDWILVGIASAAALISVCVTVWTLFRPKARKTLNTAQIQRLRDHYDNHCSVTGQPIQRRELNFNINVPANFDEQRWHDQQIRQYASHIRIPRQVW